MNYFEHHIGDYAEATSHLSFVEDAAYSRCIRKYYSTEKPLPADVKTVQRLVGARSKGEREAVAAVLEEFFDLRDDGWHNARCDEEIARYQAGEPEREAKKANEETRLKRHREERADLFQKLTAAGLHAAWNIGIKELRAMAAALPVAQPLPVTATAPLAATPPATAPATPATATQTPDTNTQPPDIDSLVGAGAPGGVERRVDKLIAIENILPAAVPPATRKHHGTEEDYTAARWMFEQVQKVNPTAKEPSWPAWANDVRLMREIDGRTHKEICELFGWAKRDAFWCANIQSPSKLREKWDTLTERRSRPLPSSAAPAASSKFHNLNDQDHSGAAAAHEASMKRMGIQPAQFDPNDPIEF